MSLGIHSSSENLNLSGYLSIPDTFPAQCLQSSPPGLFPLCHQGTYLAQVLSSIKGAFVNAQNWQYLPRLEGCP